MPGFVHDPVQAQAVVLAEDLYTKLLTPPVTVSTPFWRRRRLPEAVPGLFLHGGVGRGKSYVVDLLFDCLPFADKQRLHFHRFMLDIHAMLKDLPRAPDPLPIVAARLAATARVLVLDEFHVNDVADAMLLVGLLPALHACSVTLILTSNYAPADLYHNGLQRQRFLQVIDFISRRLQVFDFGGGCDYRARLLAREGICHLIGQADTPACLAAEYTQLTRRPAPAPEQLLLNARPLPVRGCGGGVLWVDFTELCMAPRANADYLELARQYHTILTGWIPAMNQYHDDAVRRFIHMIDIFYDHQVKFIFTAEVAPTQLYAGGLLSGSFSRTVSRLREMCSDAYLALPHRAA